jgi:hypothetical protein
MKKLSYTLALLAFATSAHAATVNVVHGIDGRDLGAAKALPVDIAVNGTCSLKGVTFSQSALVELNPASYKITVHPADGKCGVAPVITETVTIPNDGSRSFSAVASLTQTGAPRLAVFNNSKDLAFSPAVSTRHLASAGAVSVTYRSRDIGKAKSFRIRNGSAATLSVLGPRLNHSVTIAAGSKRKQLARVDGVAKGNFIVYNIVGSAKNGFSVIREKLTP